MDISGKKVAILASHGFEQSELEVPRDRLTDFGAVVHIVSPESGEIKGWDSKDWGSPVTVDMTLDDYDVLVLPGGQINPDLLRVNAKALDFIRAFREQNKLIAAVCHAPWLLIETGMVKGLKATSYKSIKTDMINAGAMWEDSEVVLDQDIITSRNPGDLEAFSNKIAEALTNKDSAKGKPATPSYA
jgi:protease I